jgi:hypothetical protein
MSFANDYIMQNIASQDGLDNEFKHIVCGDKAVDEANQKLIRKNILKEEYLECNLEQKSKDWDFERYSVEDDLEKQARFYD